MAEKRKAEGWHPGSVTAETSGVSLAHSSFTGAPLKAEEVAPGATCPVCGRANCFWATHLQAPDADREPCKYITAVKEWKVGDRVCFAHQPLGRVYNVSRVYFGVEPNTEIAELPGVFASHLFVPAPAEPISLPAIELEARDTICFTCEERVATRSVKICGVCYGDSTEEDFQDPLKELARLKALINTPELVDFVKAVQIEAVHQRERWGSKQDEGKTAADWFWLLGYLAGKAIGADKSGNRDKLLHHVITTAAACANWHAQVLGKCDMRPGIETPAGEK